ncbi:putative F-box protein PP2-B12 isoform X2 [Corylus avellana]|uniref:putative F-box protein PP2-B12 isoform X2 n=1 Tax=Corylus avellana TaxID=13451 RepID=UPI00286B6C33|nr:putative F-box protein PP2-B12 isoform X2 [Corylus avellana]
MGVTALPEECIATIISFTSPRDACRDALVSRMFGSAAGSDLVWNRFLPPDYQQIISESVSSGSSSSSSSSLNNLSKKDLYFHLCHNPILIGNGNRSFAIDKLSGKKCYMLGARELSIIWGDTPQYWDWTPSAETPVSPQSRFSEVAHLLDVCWLDIKGRIETNILSPNTRYGAYFVYTFVRSVEEGEDEEYYCTGFDRPVKVSIRFENEIEGNATNAYLLPDTPEEHDGRHPHMREDMWMEIEIGEFFTDQVHGMVEMCLMEIENGDWKSGLVVHGIELRPK